MLQGLLDSLIGIVSGSISGVVAAIVTAYGAAGIATGVWNPQKLIDRVRDFVPKDDFSKRWAAWLTYTANVNARGPNNTAPFHRLVVEIMAEFGSFPHSDFPPGSMPTGFATKTLDAMPVLTRNFAVRGAIENVWDKLRQEGFYSTHDMVELLSYLYWLLN